MNQKSHLNEVAFGDPAGARTQDPRLKRALLYQLSYGIKMMRLLAVNAGANIQASFHSTKEKMHIILWGNIGVCDCSCTLCNQGSIACALNLMATLFAPGAAYSQKKPTTFDVGF